MNPKVLVVEDHKESRKMVLSNLKIEGIQAIAVQNAEEALDTLKKNSFALILSDLKLPGISGIELLKKTKQLYPDISFIIMTAYGDVKTTVEALHEGANDFVEKPLEIDILLTKVQQILKLHSLQEENFNLKKRNLPSLIGETLTIQELHQNIERVSQQNINNRILILGESGTGKDVVARRIHALSSRYDAPFVPVNCTAIPEGLWESELFGHVKDAFTGANSDREGYFQQAHKGTLFLDEIGDIPLHLQSKLLRVIENEEVTPVGATTPEKIDVQIITATNVNLLKMVELDKFRKDLFYRINGVQLILPSLRERIDDIPLLANHLFEQNGAKCKLSEAAIKKLKSCNWPGNVRELFNVLQRTLTFMPPETQEIDVKHLKFEKSFLNTTTTSTTLDDEPLTKSLKSIREQAIILSESKYIAKVLEENKWNRTKASKQLGVSYKTLLEKIKFYGLTPPD